LIRRIEACANIHSATTKLAGALAALPDISYFNAYHAFQEHLDFLDDLQAAFPSNSAVFSAGNSVQGRPLKGIHLWGSSGPGVKPAIIWHGTVHAREWITAPTVEYLTYQIIDRYQKGEALSTRILNNYDFYVIPVVNPDGFVYTQTTDRLWRKNRQSRSSSSCIGTDVNRNWNSHWDVPGGSSTNPCSETYRGLAPSDTPENKALSNHILGIAQSVGVKFYVDWHSYSQLILLPYGYSCSAEVDDLDAQMALAAGVQSAIRGVNGLNFAYGPICSTIYQTSGGSTDWANDVAKVELAWSFELRPSGSGSGGFVIPASNIVPSGREMWAGIANLFGKF
jgi:carboxypeptidase A4